MLKLTQSRVGQKSLSVMATLVLAFTLLMGQPASHSHTLNALGHTTSHTTVVADGGTGSNPPPCTC